MRAQHVRDIKRRVRGDDDDAGVEILRSSFFLELERNIHEVELDEVMYIPASRGSL